MRQLAGGACANWRAADIVRLKDGRIVEHWNVVDRLGLLQRLGALPEPSVA